MPIFLILKHLAVTGNCSYLKQIMTFESGCLLNMDVNKHRTSQQHDIAAANKFNEIVHAHRTLGVHLHT